MHTVTRRKVLSKNIFKNVDHLSSLGFFRTKLHVYHKHLCTSITYLSVVMSLFSNRRLCPTYIQNLILKHFVDREQLIQRIGSVKSH
jgi:hypothetical protein